VKYERLTFRRGNLTSAQFTPDGVTVIYSAAWEGAPVELFSTRAGSPESRSLGVSSAEILSVSAAGEMALLLNQRYTIGFQRQGTLARAPLSGGIPRELLNDVQDATGRPTGKGSWSRAPWRVVIVSNTRSARCFTRRTSGSARRGFHAMASGSASWITRCRATIADVSRWSIWRAQ